MNRFSPTQTTTALLGMIAIAAPASLSAQPDTREDIIVSGQQEAPYAEPDLASAPAGPEIEGIISARSDNRLQVTTDDGANTVVALSDATTIKASKGFLGLGRWWRARSACATATSRRPA